MPGPPRYVLDVRPMVFEDIEEIAAYIGTQAGQSVADRVADAIVDAIADLAVLPLRHPMQAGLKKRAVRFIIVKSYRVLYSATTRPRRRVEVLRVLHGARSMSSLRRDVLAPLADVRFIPLDPAH